MADIYDINERIESLQEQLTEVKRERNLEICRLYVEDGLTKRRIADLAGMSYAHTKSILNAVSIEYAMRLEHERIVESLSNRPRPVDQPYVVTPEHQAMIDKYKEDFERDLAALEAKKKILEY